MAFSVHFKHRFQPGCDIAGQVLRSFVNTGPARTPATGADFGTFAPAYEQHFDIWFSMFYYDRAPDRYTSLADQ